MLILIIRSSFAGAIPRALSIASRCRRGSKRPPSSHPSKLPPRTQPAHDGMLGPQPWRATHVCAASAQAGGAAGPGG